MNVHELIHYMLQACDALAAAHALGIVHRDMKPDNLFIIERPDGSTSVKVLDFGLSKVVPRSPNAQRQKALTADAQVLGTAHYMSPEQWVASKDVGPAADIWAVGVIMYEAITGESPFMRNNLAAMCNAVLREDPEPIATFRDEVPEDLVAVVDRCLAKKPADRYATIGDLARDLVRLAGDKTPPPKRFSLPPPPQSVPSAPGSLAAVSSPAPSSRRTLGLVGPAGHVESWADVLETSPPPSTSRVPAMLAAVIAVGVAIAYFLM
jgi:serine/threonine-protein kinase